MIEAITPRKRPARRKGTRMLKVNPKTKTLLLKTLIHVISLWALVRLFYLGAQDLLGADPVKEVIHSTGMGAFNLILLTLLVSPLAKKLKAGWLMQVRRLLGIYTFVYALIHLLSYIFFELQFDFTMLISEIIERPYITVGMAALIILLPLTVTSLKYYQRKMGRKWQSLHNWVYLAAILVAVHFYWSIKSDLTEPLIYFAITGVLLWLRKDKIKKALTK